MNSEIWNIFILDTLKNMHQKWDPEIQRLIKITFWISLWLFLFVLFLRYLEGDDVSEEIQKSYETIFSIIIAIFSLCCVWILIYWSVKTSITKKIRKDNVEKYRRYLNSEDRDYLKEKRLSEQSTCECCWKRKAIILHHLSYERVGSEEYSDLVCVCSVCHHKCHYDDWWHKIKLDEFNLRWRFDILKSGNNIE